jgi:hypothetical protein
MTANRGTVVSLVTVRLISNPPVRCVHRLTISVYYVYALRRDCPGFGP